ncbi:MAG: DNA internalization-related competence protein ComEC/Rec2 [Bacillota bacterium]|nr:DNA internalization-related competence protein ComEC/Rec2 [Bacillota bacterium]
MSLLFLPLLFLPLLFFSLRDKDFRPLLLLFSLALGFFLCSARLSQLNFWDAQTEEMLRLEGWVLESQSSKDEEDYRLSLLLSKKEGEKLPHSLVYVYGTGEAPPPGSLVRLQAQLFLLETAGNTNAFDYHRYLQNQGIAASFRLADGTAPEILKAAPAWSPALFSSWLRDRLNKSLSQVEPEQQALLKGVFLGDKSSLDYRQKTVLGLSGISHAFAVSGMHISYVLLLASILAGKGYKKRWLRLLVAILFLLFYLALTDLRPSVLRAACMSLLMLLGQALHQPRDLLSNLSLAALLSLLFNPLWVADAGFLLSYGAVLGLFLYRRHWEQSLFPLPGPLRSSISTSLAASVFTLPLCAYYFYHISCLGLLFSPLAVLAAGFSVCLCLFAALAALLSTGLGSFLLQIAAWPMELLYELADHLSRLPFCASLPGAIPWQVLLPLLLILLFLPRIFSASSQSRGKALSRQITGAASFLLLLFAALPQLLSNQGQDYTELVFLDVGQGDCSLVITEEQQTILIDGGGSRESGSIGENNLLPYLKSRGIDHIDLMISTHPDQDHIDGLLSVLENLPVDTVCYSALAEENPQQQKLLQLSREQNSLLLPIRGHRLSLGKSAELLFFPLPEAAAENSNDASLVFRLLCQGVSVLFTGDATAETLCRLSESYDLRADVLHLPHHGSRSGYSPAFYRATGSKLAILSVGRQNNYGHPADSVVEYWQKAGTLYRTDQQGEIRLFIRSGEFHINENN